MTRENIREAAKRTAPEGLGELLKASYAGVQNRVSVPVQPGFDHNKV